MGVYENIRNNTYKKPQGVYAKIHANDKKTNIQTYSADNTKKVDKLWVEDKAPNVLEKKNVNATVKPLDVVGFVKDFKNSEAVQKNNLIKEIDNVEKQIKKKEQEYNRANNISDWNKKNQTKALIQQELDALNANLNKTQDSLKQLSPKNSKLMTGEELEEINKNLPFPQKVDRFVKATLPETAEKVGRTSMDLIGNVATGMTQGIEGYVDAGVGVGGTALSGLANLVGKKELAQNIKNKAEQIAGYGFAKDMQALVDEKSRQGEGIYKPSVLGAIDVRDAAREIARMYTVGRTGGMPGLMISAAGGNVEEALNEGESLGRATAYGAISGSLEGIAEKMFDPAKILGGGLKTIGKGFLGKIAEATVGEGAEEGITAALNPFVKMLTYEGETENPFGSWDNFKNYLRDIGQSVYQGAIIGGLTLGVSAPGNVDLQKSFSNDVYKAVEKIQGITQARKREIADTILEGAKQSKNIEGLQKNEALNQAQAQNIEQPNVTLPNQAEMAQKVNMKQITQTPNLPTQKAQETLQSAKIAGMTDMDIQKAKELNDMLRSGTRLKFYDPQNIPQGVDVSRAADANGFYMDGTLWINKNSEMKVERILGHELTHHIENDDLINTILDSNIFYDFLSEKGFSNTSEFKKYLKEKKGYKQEELTSEMVAHFAEEKLFGKEETINRLARENRTLAQKILNWLSDLKTKIAGSSEAKELLRIENMYRKALEQARNTTTSNTADVKYHIKNIADFNETEYNNIQEMQLSPKEYGKLAHIVDTDPSIKPGVNRVSTSDATYVIYQKEYNDFKVVDKYEGGVENDTIANGNIQGVDNARDGRSGFQVSIDNIRNEGTTKSDDELLNRNTRARSVKVESDNDGISNKKSVAGKEPAFSMPETDNQGRKLSKEQQEFFKDSKVRDENGNLLVVYHGSKNSGFTIFNYDKNNQTGTDYGRAYYFTSDYKKAQGYSYDSEKDVRIQKYEEERKKLLNKFLETNSEEDRENFRNYKLDGKRVFEMINDEDYLTEGGEVKEVYLNLTNPLIADAKGQYYFKVYDDYFKQARENANDGIIVKNVIDNPRGEHRPIDVYIAFEPNQIKNVDNTNPTSNPDIRYSMNPVEVAKKPPNIESGLDQLTRTKRIKEGDSQSSFTKNINNQSIFDDKFKELALDDKNIKSYERISNKETLQQANDAINEQGQKWVDRFLEKPNGEMKATDIAGGFILMSRYQQTGDYESMIRVAEKLRKAGTQQGQTIQMFSVLGRMTPEGMTYYAQKELSKAYDEILKNKTQKWADEHADEFKLNEKDIEYIQRRVNQAARLPDGRDKYVLLGEIASRIQNKIPPQAGQGLKALARNSMLLNPKTMVRNILGNVVIVPNHIVSDFVGAGIDKAISKKTGVRTTGGFDVKALQGAKKGVYESFDDFRRKISTREMGGDRFEIGQGKNFYENHTGRFGETRNKINKALNGLDRVTGFLLETGDRPFYETWFINSLNNQMKLNNVTEPTAEMIEIATDEALQRTWQDNNSYTRVVKSVRDGLNKLNVKGYGLGDMVMPFVKTPANLTKAVVDFSPLGAINAAIKTSQFNKDIGKGTATTKQQREVVKAWSQVITGTLGMAMLTALANAGVLTGGSDEDKDVRAFEQNILGIKPYSIKIGDKTYTYDWAQPLGTSAAMVADTVKSLKNAKDTEGKVAAILEGAQSGASVLLEQSFVSGIRNLFEEDNLINALIETGFNEASKFTPQFLSQLAQIQDDTARTSYVYNNIPQTALNKVKAKIPGLRQTLEPSVDVLGREVKTDNSVGNVMFNPANTAFARTTEGAEEMYRIYQATGDKATIAQVAPYYFNVGSEKIVLTPKQRTQYQKTIGKIASDGVENLLKNKAYKSLEDTDKAEILKDLYSYGTAIAKAEASTSYLLPSEMQKIKDSGMSPEEYILLKYISNLGGTKKDEKYNSLISAGYSQKETEEFLTDYKGYKFESTSKNTLPSLKQQTVTLPTLEEQKAKLKPLKK